MEDPIQNLLSTMGWSCDDLLAKLQQFKNVSNANSLPKDPNHSSYENTDNDSSQNSNNCDEIRATSSNAQGECAKENAEDETKPVENDSDLAITKVPACLQNGAKAMVDNLETETNDNSDKCNSESAIPNIENDYSSDKINEDLIQNQGVVEKSTENEEIISVIDDDESFTLELEDDTFESGNESDKNIREEVDVIISLMEDDDTETFKNGNESFESENDRNFKEFDQTIKEDEVTINFSMEDIEESENESYLSYLKEVAEAGERSKNEEGTIICLTEDDDTETEDKPDTFKAENERNVKELDTNQNIKQENVAIISLMEDDDIATFETKTPTSKSENEKEVKESNDNQTIKEEGVGITSLLEDPETFGSKIECSKSEDEVKELDDNQSTKGEKVAITSFMEDPETFGNRNETSKSENDSNVKEVAETDQNAKGEAEATNTVMEVDDTANTSKSENERDVRELDTNQSRKDDDTETFQDKTETSKAENEGNVKELDTNQSTKEEKVAIISLMEDDGTASFGNNDKSSKSEDESNIKDSKETDQNTKEKEVGIISLMADDDIAAFENKTKTSKLENKRDVKELESTESDKLAISLIEDDDVPSDVKNLETDLDPKGTLASISLMEEDDDTAAFGNEPENWKTKSDEIQVKKPQEIMKNYINSSIKDDAAITDKSKVDNATETLAEESNNSGNAVFLKPTATVKEFTEAKKSETSQDEEPKPQQNEEEVRNMLRMQILQLRNKKKADVIPTPLDKDLITRKVPESKKKKRKISTDEEKDEPIPAKKVALEGDGNKKEGIDSVLLPNESGFLIVDVIGGYKSPEPDEKEQQPPPLKIETPTTRIINEHLEGEPMHLTKTTNYKNIKGWQRKKFIVPIDEKKPPKANPVVDDATASCSFEKPVAPPQEPIKSAFESNLLDTFLVEHAQLNISYEVPKLHAEGSITHNDLLVPVKSFDVNLEKLADDKRPLERYKPKTLAEKRKMLQRVERKKEKQRELEEVKPETEKPSGVYVSKMYCKGKIIKVRTRVPYGGYVYYMTKQGLSKWSRRLPKKSHYVMEAPDEAEKIEKPSLLTCLRTPKKEKVCYKPGPLSMKRKLQNLDSTSEWATVIKKLPRITLEVFPEFCKSVDPKILHYLDFNEKLLTEENVDFALAALKSEENQRKGFVFPVKYKNDEQFMLFRQQRPRVPVTTTPPEEDAESAVQIVIHKLLNYVEISEIADDLIKPDPEQRISEKPDTVKPLPPINNRIDAIIKSSRKRRTSLELRRLNVKIIDVDVAEKDDNEKVCLKLCCKMGCICKSLECGKSYNFHCGNQECMLDCKCNYSRLKHSEKVILPAGTDILSVGTVSHLQKQAKKNLAKVEKEFVQTVIQSNDRTIILGTGTRDRQRRATKLPRKMNDYVALQNIDDDGEKKVQETPKTACKKQLAKPMKCVVKLERLDLSDLIPLCLVHKLYDCHCGLKAPYPAPDPQIKPKKPTPKPSPERSPEPIKLKIKRLKPIEITYIEPETINPPRPATPEQCARTKRVHTKKYRLRNSAVGYLERLRKMLAQKERLLPRNGPKIYVPPMSPPPGPLKVHKRKQAIELRDDLPVSDHGVEIISIRKEKAMQRRKRKKIGSGSGCSVEMVPAMESLCVETQQEQTRSLMEELGKYLEKETQDKVHLMPWSLLISGYKDGSLQVWCNLKAKKMLITTTNIRPSKTYMNVNFLQHCLCNKEEINIDIIRCLITNKVPKDKNPKEVLLVLTFNDTNHRTTYYEVRGICEKSGSTCESSVSLIKSDLTADVPSSAQTFMHQTKENELKLIPIIRRFYIDRLLTYHRKSTTVENSQPVIQVPLPEINENERWCMVSIVRRFMYLSFADLNYSIKKVDIGNLAELARCWQQTLILEAKHFNSENPEFQKNIYIVPTHKDRIFVGPYAHDEIAKIETLDYLHRVLVNTDLYCQMKGELATSCRWLTQIYSDCDSTVDEIVNKQRSLLKQNVTSTITSDLVVIEDDDDDDQDNNVEQQQASTEKAEVEEPAVEETSANDDDDDVVLVKDKEYIRQCNLKRYFVSNVKGLGYVIGKQLPQSKVIDVTWPLTNTILRYSKAEDAIEGVERQLNQSLIPMPPDFKIQVTMVDEPDSTLVPFQLQYGRGHYAVGEFGICDLARTPPSEYPFPGGMTVELAKEVKERTERALFRECKKLIDYFTRSSKVHSQPFKSVPSILEGAKTEIKYQEETFDKLNKTKIALELQRLELVQKLNALEDELREPPTVAAKEEVLIEISDDEDDEQQQESTSKKIQIEKMPKLTASTKLVPPLIKITKTSVPDGNKLIISPHKPAPPPFKTQRSLLKVPVQGVLKKTPSVGGQKYVLVRDAADPDIIKRLKINSGLQVSVADNDSPSQQQNETTPAAASSMQVQTCEIVTVKENNGLKCVSLKRRIPVTELQSLVKKQLCAAGKGHE